MEWLGKFKSEQSSNDLVSKLAEVQTYLDTLTFSMEARAVELLNAERDTGASEILREKGDVDWYIILSDERGQQDALAIEYGHGQYQKRYRAKNGRWFAVTVPASEGLYILTRATGIQRLGKAPHLGRQ